MPGFPTIKFRDMKKTSKRKKWRIILAIIAVVLLGTGLYAYREFNRKVKDLSKTKADMEISTTELITAFESNESQANQAYLDKIISVSGVIRAIEKDDQGFYSIVMGEKGSLSSVRCNMDSRYVEDISDLVSGSQVSIKGACTGFNADELLGSDVILNRSVLTD